MAHYNSRAHESASTMLTASWGAILFTALGGVLLPIATMVLLSYPALGLGVGVGLLLRPSLEVGRRAGRSLTGSGTPQERQIQTSRSV